MTMTLNFKDQTAHLDSPSSNDNTDPNARLLAATKSLEKAAQNQCKEIHKYRDAISNLNDKVKELENGCTAYDRAVGRINVKPLHARALKLGRIMGGSLKTL